MQLINKMRLEMRKFYKLALTDLNSSIKDFRKPHNMKKDSQDCQRDTQKP